MTVFQAGGALPTDHPARVSRPFERAVLQEVLARRWVLLLGPRQHGKTSGLAGIRKELIAAGFLCAHVDLQETVQVNDYDAFCRWVALKVADETNMAIDETAIAHRGSIREWLVAATPPGRGPIAIIIDEASAVPNPGWVNLFYGQIRAINSEIARSSPGAFARRLGFVFSGTFRSETLVTKNSPFNVSELVYSDDLSLSDARELARAGQRQDLDEVVRVAFEHVGGQPYLLQRILKEADVSGSTGGLVAAAATIERLRAGNDQHLHDLFRMVREDEALLDLTRQLLDRGELSDIPGDDDLKFLHVTGLAVRAEGTVRFRNRVYGEVASAVVAAIDSGIATYPYFP